MAVALSTTQSGLLQAEIQRELERREWAEPEDNVMAEYITVLLANGNSRERVQTEMDDLVGSDFDPSFLTWLFDKAAEITATPPSLPDASSSIPPLATAAPTADRSRLLNNALAPFSSQPESSKRKLDSGSDEQNKKRLSDGPGVFGAPPGPRGMGVAGRGLADRIGPAGRGGRGGMQVRGVAGRQPGGPQMGMGVGMGQGAGPMGFRPGFRPGMMRPNFPAGPQPFGIVPGQQEMMAQMMAMQMGMAQMAEMVQHMAAERQRQPEPAPTPPPTVAARPPRPPAPVKLPPGTKLGSHAVSSAPPSVTSAGPIPNKPKSTALCKYSFGCTNSRCPFSHPSPVADAKTGMVLSEEACEKGKDCKDGECIKSHVSPAAVLGDAAGPSRLLCKFQNCMNPSCPYRHEDPQGNPIPPPALTAVKAKATKSATSVVPAAPASDDDGEIEIVGTSGRPMDGVLDDSNTGRPCRYAERCTRADCKFSHPSSRALPGTFGRPARTSASPFSRSGNGMNMSKKFGVTAEKKLDPSVEEFKPSNVNVVEMDDKEKVEKELAVTG